MREHSYVRRPVTVALVYLFAGWAIMSGDVVGGDDGMVTHPESSLKYS